MNKLKVKVVVTLLILLSLVPLSFGVLLAEKQKRALKAKREYDYYSSLNTEYVKYLEDITNQLTTIRQETGQKMTDAQIQYKSLLTQQPQLVAQHTRAINANDTTAGSVVVATVTSGGGTSTTTTTVSKPKSTPKTATS